MKKIILLFSVFFAAHQLSAQTLTKKQLIAGDTGDDEVTAGLIYTSDGGYLAGGYSNSLPGTNKKSPNYGSWDYWVIKYDASGKKVWDKSYGGNDYEILESMIQTSDSGYLFGGQSLSNISGVKSEDSRGNGDMWIVKTDSHGNKLWDKTYGGTDYDDLSSVAQTKDGGYILCGVSYSNSSGEKNENSYGSGDYWIIKIDAAGTIQWQKTFGGTKYDVGTNIAQTSDGGYFIAGHSQSGRNGNKTSNTRGSDDIWILKTDSLGNKLWDKTIGGSGSDFMVSLDATTDGGYLLGTWSGSGISGDKTEASQGGIDYWLVKVNSAGTILWQKVVGGSGADYLSSAGQTSDGGYILAGYSNSGISGDKTEASRGGDWDSWVVKLSADRQVVWNKTAGGSALDQAGKNGILELPGGQYILASTSNSPASGDKTVPNRGDYDLWLTGIQYSPVALADKAVKTSVTSLSSSSFAIVPNPVKSIMHVRAEGKAVVTLADQNGKLILSQTINGRADINVSHLAAGIYYLKNSTTNEVKKVVITK